MGVFSCGGDLLDVENLLRLHKPKIRFFLPVRRGRVPLRRSVTSSSTLGRGYKTNLPLAGVVVCVCNVGVTSVEGQIKSWRSKD